MKIFESKRFGALLTGTIAFATFALMNMTSWEALALAAIVMGLYFLILYLTSQSGISWRPYGQTVPLPQGPAPGNAAHQLHDTYVADAYRI